MTVIRRAEWHELPSVVSLCQQFHAETEWQDIPFVPDVMLAALTALLSDDSNNLLVVADGEQIVGAVGIQIAPMYWGTDAVATELFWYIDPAYRGRSCSLRLFQQAEAWAKEAGAKVMLMGSLATSPPHVRTMYERAGYRYSQSAFIKRLN